ncbi:gamma-glutamyl phosphate reductase [Glycocaulis alkaliphilus]|uniref:Gamma-glutamyl phosphate reductase n=1 Tax=Glycocaulis alkaliphilus TaxID=1434191 RepID=A0A3T0E6M4_9PROT|nr:glutamate-5-semialdehyde dehydrogenase [Glycocaulis alkaliphilus]AZU02867.1 gamma-glutamyl phosphate reductase [Glycocaulis alkaliphilus]GGB84709.1 gamma-glutamyl phosphate reductase [Glycocaulis alkaliphilus]
MSKYQPGWAGRAGADLRAAARTLADTSADRRTAALTAMADALQAASKSVLAANADDVARAQSNGTGGAMLDRLRLDPARLDGIVEGIRAVARHTDPIGREIMRWTRPNGLVMAQVRVPIGAIGVIFESRPNVAADAAALCVRSGNAVVLRGGSDAASSVAAIIAALRGGLREAGLPEAIITTPPDADRAYVGDMLAGVDGALDLVIPRGGKALVKRVQEEARVPVLGHLDGLCHVYVDGAAEPDMAERLVVNSKMRRTGVCNAAECVLIDRQAGEAMVTRLVSALQAAGCEVRGDSAVRALASSVTPASPEDFDTEYLDAIVSMAVVEGVEGALVHITRHGSGHTEAIITGDETAAHTFLARVDAGVVMHNASTGFSDGGEFGFGAEIGIATGRIHARGPVGADQLTSWKYQVFGTGQTRP